MFLDLDRFKPINDSLGHAAGDRMLQEVATRLSACVSQDDTVARMGGDEFTLLLPSQGDREIALKRAIQVAELILGRLARPFTLEGREFFVTASIGVALSPQDGAELSLLMKNADTAMYHAKEMGKNNFQFYQAEMNARALERLELESDLRRALELGEFVLHYQPQFTGDGRRLTGAEALLRWQHPAPRTGSAERVHSGAGGDRPGRPGRRLAAGGSLQAVAQLAQGQGAGAKGLGEPLGTAVRRWPVGRADRRDPLRDRHPAGLPGAGADRKHPDE